MNSLHLIESSSDDNAFEDAELLFQKQKQREEEHRGRLISEMQDIYDITANFATDLDGTKGLAVFGPAGIGKTQSVTQALINSKASVEYLKGADISPAGLYCTLWFNRDPHRILVLDDVDLISGGEKSKQIMALLKAATENTYKPREIAWIKAAPNATMKEHNIPNKFEYWGNIVWITNDNPREIMKKKSLAPHFRAILSRFTPAILDWNKADCYMWTKHLIEWEDMLGKNCQSKKGGYDKDVIADVLKFFRENFKALNDITPRLATKIAHNRYRFHEDDRWVSMSRNTSNMWTD